MKYTPEYSSRFRILKGGKISLVVSAMLAGTTMSFASPSGGVVNAGSATISQNGSTTNINQTTQRATINWQSFSIAPTETVNFVQPNSSAVTLNRVVGNETSLINGALNANGQVWILNSNGILFGKNASVNTAGLVASTMNITDKNFMNGHYTFESTGSNASVINMGTIRVTNGAYVALLGKKVANEGLIQATKGTVALTAGDKVSLNFNGDSLVGIAIDQGTLNALVENKGAIIADGGTILLTTQAANDLINGVVNNSGLLQAKTLDDITGHIELYAHGGTTNVSGTVDASGGFIETSGKELSVASGTTIKAANWLIDPTDITIESAGGSSLAGSSISGGTLTSTLNGGTDITLAATNDININQAFTWSQNLLTLTAGHDINVNAAMSATGTAGLALNYTNALTMKRDDVHNAFVGKVDFTGTNTLSINGNNYTIISDVTALQEINAGLNGNYVLGSNLDLTGVEFTSIGSYSNQFTGQFEGLGHTISNLTINTPDNADSVGLFGYINGTHIGNIGVVGGSVTGKNHVGGLVGFGFDSSIVNSFSTATVSGADDVGGLVGYSGNASSIANSYFSGTVTGSTFVGGLVGFAVNSSLIDGSYAMGAVSGNDSIGGLIGYVKTVRITDSYAMGTVSGNDVIGGLVGISDTSFITNSYATGSVIGHDTLGGLVGYQDTSFLMNSYATGSINGNNNIGGLVGFTANSSLLNTHASGTVNGNNSIGGLVGFEMTGSSIVNSYATGTVSGSDNIGGLVGYQNSSSIINSYATGDVSGNTVIGGLVGAENGSVISNSYATGGVTGYAAIGGLVGNEIFSVIDNSYATGTITGSNSSIGGLVGIENFSLISNSHSTSAVNGGNYIGALVGYQSTSSIIINSYATGEVLGNGDYVGGLVGYQESSFNTNDTTIQPLIHTLVDQIVTALYAPNTFMSGDTMPSIDSENMLWRSEGGNSFGTVFDALNQYDFDNNEEH